MSATWTRKTEALKHGAQFQCITVEIKERFETQNPPVWPPTKPPTDRHSTNFTKEHKSLKVFQSWSYRCQVSLFNLDERNWPIYIAKKRFSLFLKIKLLQKVLLIMLIQLVCLLSYFRSRDVTLESCLFKCKSNSRANEWLIGKTILQRTSVIRNEQSTYEAEWVIVWKLKQARSLSGIATNSIRNLGFFPQNAT